jgi:hypothetical protein
MKSQPRHAIQAWLGKFHHDHSQHTQRLSLDTDQSAAPSVKIGAPHKRPSLRQPFFQSKIHVSAGSSGASIPDCRTRDPHHLLHLNPPTSKNHRRHPDGAVRSAKCIGRESNPGLAETGPQRMLVTLKTWQRLILPLNHRCDSRFSQLKTYLFDEMFPEFEKYNHNQRYLSLAASSLPLSSI